MTFAVRSVTALADRQASYPGVKRPDSAAHRGANNRAGQSRENARGPVRRAGAPEPGAIGNHEAARSRRCGDGVGVSVCVRAQRWSLPSRVLRG